MTIADKTVLVTGANRGIGADRIPVPTAGTPRGVDRRHTRGQLQIPSHMINDHRRDLPNAGKYPNRLKHFSITTIASRCSSDPAKPRAHATSSGCGVKNTCNSRADNRRLNRGYAVLSIEVTRADHPTIRQDQPIQIEEGIRRTNRTNHQSRSATTVA